MKKINNVNVCATVLRLTMGLVIGSAISLFLMYLLFNSVEAVEQLFMEELTAEVVTFLFTLWFFGIVSGLIAVLPELINILAKENDKLKDAVTENEIELKKAKEEIEVLEKVIKHYHRMFQPSASAKRMFDEIKDVAGIDSSMEKVDDSDIAITTLQQMLKAKKSQAHQDK